MNNPAARGSYRVSPAHTKGMKKNNTQPTPPEAIVELVMLRLDGFRLLGLEVGGSYGPHERHLTHPEEADGPSAFDLAAAGLPPTHVAVALVIALRATAQAIHAPAPLLVPGAETLPPPQFVTDAYQILTGQERTVPAVQQRVTRLEAEHGRQHVTDLVLGLRALAHTSHVDLHELDRLEEAWTDRAVDLGVIAPLGSIVPPTNLTENKEDR